MEEQTAYCVIDVSKKADATGKFPGQDKIVPWQICVDSGKSFDACYSQVGISSQDVQSCLSDSDRMNGLITTYLSKGSIVHGTPLEQVNGQNADANYDAIKSAICAADSSLTACSSGPTPPSPTPPSPTPPPPPSPTPPSPTPPPPTPPSPIPPSPTPSPSPTPGSCHAICSLVTDDWCNANCAMGNCPANLCKCDSIVI